MNEIIDTGVKRQVQPKDLSFLSEASQELVAVIQGLLVGIGVISIGMGDIHPVIISGLEKTVNNGIATINEGFVLYKKRIYKIASYTGASGVKYCFKNDLVVVAPSPVKDKDFANTVNCHYNTYGVIVDFNNMNYEAPEYEIYYDNVSWGSVLKRITNLSAQ